jgi:hypothetical protein
MLLIADLLSAITMCCKSLFNADRYVRDDKLVTSAASAKASAQRSLGEGG